MIRISITRPALLAAALLAFLPLAVEGHHAANMFEPKKEITVTGVVKEFQFTNPHSWLLVDVTSDDGSVVTWGFEAEGPSAMMRAGIRKSDLAPGTKVTITGRPMKNGQPAAAWVKAVRADGVVFNPGLGLAPPAPDAGGGSAAPAPEAK
jgi:Family of unknown function (DUF6152)